jgi:hypothetical protein
MRYKYTYDPLTEEWRHVIEISFTHKDREWNELSQRPAEKLLEVALSELGYRADKAAHILFSQYPESWETAELLWRIRRDPIRYVWIGYANNKCLINTLERIAFDADDALPCAKELAIRALVLIGADLRKFESTLLYLLNTDLKLVSWAALVRLGYRIGIETVIECLADKNRRFDCLNLLENVFENISQRELEIIVIPILYKTDCSYSDLAFRMRMIQLLLRRPLSSKGYKQLEALLKEWVTHEGIRVRGLLHVLRTYINDEVLYSPDGGRYKFAMHQSEKCHRSNKKLLIIIEELIKQI